jgi:hypothetical protein
MRGFIRTWVYLLSLALAVNGVLLRNCASMHQPSPHSAVAAVSHDHHGRHDAAHGEHAGHHGADHNDATGSGEPSAIADQGYGKCCGVCTLAVALLSQPGDSVVIETVTLTFSRLSDRLSGAEIRVDPGIPKRIA